MSDSVIEIVRTNGNATESVGRAAYEHPLVVRLCHWLNAISLFVMVGSGLQIFRAFPSFGAKIPQKDLLNWPKSLAIGGWLDEHGHNPGGNLANIYTSRCSRSSGLHEEQELDEPS